MTRDLNTAGGAATSDLLRAMSRRTALKAGALGAVGTMVGGSLFSPCRLKPSIAGATESFGSRTR